MDLDGIAVIGTVATAGGVVAAVAAETGGKKNNRAQELLSMK